MTLCNAQSRIIFKYWLPPLGWALLIFDFSSKSFENLTLPFEHLDKLIHAGEYGVLCLLLYRAFIHTQRRWCREKAVMLSILLCMLYGISDEIHQMFIPMRTPDVLDFLADSMGAGLSHIGLWSVRSFNYRTKKDNSSFFPGIKK